MRKIIFAIVLSALFSFIAMAQTESQSQASLVGSDDGYWSYDFLESDYRQSDLVAYVHVKEIVSVGSSDDKTDCVNFTGVGYCGFRVRAEVKEVYKGRISTKTIEFTETGEAQLIKSKDRFLGEKVVFLEKGVIDGKTYWQPIENSTRTIEFSVLEKMRLIARKKSNKKQ